MTKLLGENGNNAPGAPVQDSKNKFPTVKSSIDMKKEPIKKKFYLNKKFIKKRIRNNDDDEEIEEEDDNEDDEDPLDGPPKLKTSKSFLI